MEANCSVRLRCLNSYQLAVCAAHQRAEDRPCALVVFDRTFWMPLHGDHKMISVSPLHRFDDSVLRTTGDHAKSVADGFRGLMMARVDGDGKRSFHGRGE